MPFLAREAPGGVPYRVHLPDPLTAGEGPHPAVLFLHGYGESGGDNEAQLRIGLPPLVVPGSPWERAVVIAPQKPEFDRLWPDFADRLDAILADAEGLAPLSDRRVLTGLSQGGHGTLALAKALRWTFARIAPVCGWADPKRPVAFGGLRENRRWTAEGEWADPDAVRARCGGVPAWLFHGEVDEVVPAARSREVAAILGPLTEAGGARLTLYPGVGHDSWTRAYADPELPGWLLG